MVLLENLSIPSFTAAVRAFFAAEGIVTVEDFLLHDLHKFLAVAEQSAVCVDVKEAVVEALSYLENLQEKWKDGLGLSQQPVGYLSLGCESIDKLLEGGIQEGTLTELVGASSTGKTQICMQAAACAAYNQQCSVIYVDTCGAFSSQRVAHMLGGMLGSLLQVEEQRTELTLSLKSIERIAVFDIFSLLTFLQGTYDKLLTESENWRLRLLIIDSVSSVISPVLGGNHSQGHALMISVGQILKKLAARQRLAILFTNHTVAGIGGQPRPALGGSWKSVPHTRLMLSHDSPRSDVYRMSILKHTGQCCSRQTTFRIGRAGLHSFDTREVATGR
ncbi:hypothetical protein R1sor_017968 [Riccia sorocarpa]|uniref:RecA family profile 1 domain-containing protein n=1 Tax=Riccia sorocarpa TaxID=122646 RepID=A0ABD3I9G3_9MARC